jgi:hypothetical protein
VFDNKEIRKIFRPKTDEVNGGFMILGIEEFCDLYKSSSRILKWDETRNVYRILVVKPLVKWPLGG